MVRVAPQIYLSPVKKNAHSQKDKEVSRVCCGCFQKSKPVEIDTDALMDSMDLSPVQKESITNAIAADALPEFLDLVGKVKESWDKYKEAVDLTPSVSKKAADSVQHLEEKRNTHYVSKEEYRTIYSRASRSVNQAVSRVRQAQNKYRNVRQQAFAQGDMDDNAAAAFNDLFPRYYFPKPEASENPSQ
ncbi:MAG: hypothetical protein SP4CHLAM5_12030 [Chlamydiia bacterium]|nr:hypothetical protein [Chlamydiia bacterium]MCH9619057.1 hypothetical protein [Chlamydiia bacterium]